MANDLRADIEVAVPSVGKLDTDIPSNSKEIPC